MSALAVLSLLVAGAIAAPGTGAGTAERVATGGGLSEVVLPAGKFESQQILLTDSPESPLQPIVGEGEPLLKDDELTRTPKRRYYGRPGGGGSANANSQAISIGGGSANANSQAFAGGYGHRG